MVRVDGGAERLLSVANALEYLRSVAADDDLVMVHDAVRPCVAVADIERVVAAARGRTHGAVLAVPVCDTLKRAGPEGSIADTVDRSRLWRAFTPQVFPLGRLRAALGSVIESGRVVTDEAQAMEHAGARPLLVEGSPGNVKIHLPGRPCACPCRARDGGAAAVIRLCVGGRALRIGFGALRPRIGATPPEDHVRARRTGAGTTPPADPAFARVLPAAKAPAS